MQVKIFCIFINSPINKYCNAFTKTRKSEKSEKSESQKSLKNQKIRKSENQKPSKNKRLFTMSYMFLFYCFIIKNNDFSILLHFTYKEIYLLYYFYFLTHNKSNHYNLNLHIPVFPVFPICTFYFLFSVLYFLFPISCILFLVFSYFPICSASLF